MYIYSHSQDEDEALKTRFFRLWANNYCLNSYQVHLPSVNAFKKSLCHLVF